MRAKGTSWAAHPSDRQTHRRHERFVVHPRRWVVERTLSRLMRSRRLARDYETRPESSEAAVLWSMTMLTGRRLARHRSRNVTRQPAPA
ncbi:MULTISPECIES: transposase [Streptomyces]|uniref:transposase n=1 Tax=Streptomyces sp. Ag109_G2-6 TaxID=2485154 RepID=UPI001F468891|nr:MULTISPECIES: transposase [Streptomyces]